MDGLGNLKGWQWLFLIEGALTVVMGIYVAFTLADLPINVSDWHDAYSPCLEAMHPTLTTDHSARG